MAAPEWSIVHLDLYYSLSNEAPPQKICPHIKCIVSLSTQLLFVFDVHHLMLNIVFSHL